jgi:hypothetical protein
MTGHGGRTMRRNKVLWVVAFLGLPWLGGGSPARADTPCDFLCYMTAANEASLVMLREQALLPTDLAHHLLAFDAALLGFDGPVENSHDANLLSSADVKIEFANTLANSAIHAGQFTQDLHAQYREARPWMGVDESTTDISTLMPQKRNPRPVDRLRSRATDVVAGAQAVMLAAHNTNTGMNDYRGTEPLFAVTDAAQGMYAAWAKLLGGLRVDPAAARAVVEGDYATMTEVADTLLREAGVPFRVAHHYASELTDYGRARGKRPPDLTDDELQAVYREAIGEPLPLPPGAPHSRARRTGEAARIRGRHGEPARHQPQAHRPRLAQGGDRARQCRTRRAAAVRRRRDPSQQRLSRLALEDRQRLRLPAVLRRHAHGGQQAPMGGPGTVHLGTQGAGAPDGDAERGQQCHQRTPRHRDARHPGQRRAAHAD